MKKLILTLILVVLTTTGFTQKPIKSITVTVDTVQEMTWSKALDFKTAKDQDLVTYTRLLKWEYIIVIDLIKKTVSYVDTHNKNSFNTFKLLKYKRNPTSYFVEIHLDGRTTNEKLLICENEDGTYSAISQSGSNVTDTLSKGDFDRNVNVVVK
jgi:hypothetical protein